MKIRQLLNQGADQQGRGQLVAAEQAYCQALVIDPDHAEALYRLGSLSHEQGDDAKALTLLNRAILLRPGQGSYHFNLACVLTRLGDLDAAIASYWRVVHVDPEDSGAFFQLGTLLMQVERRMEARDFLQRAVDLAPDHVDSRINLALVLRVLYRFQAARAHLEAALTLKPYDPRILVNLGLCYMDQGAFKKAEFHYKRALEVDPDYRFAWDDLLYLYSYNVLLGPHDMYSVHRAWGLRMNPVNPLAARPGGSQMTRDRRLRIAYVSPDLRRHPVSYFIEPILAHHDHARFEVFCYAELACPDDVTTALRAMCDGWRVTVGQSDEAVAQQIRDDGIDILVDLAGHTAGNRLGVFRYRPAPVQVSYLGYFTTTGLPVMDYWLTDAVVTPMDTVELATETLWRLPACSLCYTPPGRVGDVVPDVDLRQRSGPLVLGSFNDLSKVSPATIALWSAVMQALPDAQLFLKARQLSDARMRDQLIAGFAKQGVDGSRLRLLGRTAGVSEHLALYGAVDIALDTIPRTGGTTTAEALWMGVPVVTLAGDRYISRLSATMLSAVGLDDWIVHDHAAYIDCVIKLAKDSAGRMQWRRLLRDRVRDSDLCDGAGLAARIETAYRAMWQRVCVAADNDHHKENNHVS